MAYSRRDVLKTLGIATGASAFHIPDLAKLLGEIPNPLHKTLDKPITAITLGAGSRGNVYGNYAISNPDQIDIVGVAEPIPLRNERYSKKHKIATENRFVTWEHVFQKPKFADAIIITTPDHLHYGPCMKALAMGYDVLLEKPMAQTEKECRDILALTKKTGAIVGLCHVLRYAPYFIKLKELIHNGSIGELISIQHFEPIQHIHMAHSFVRGNWHNSKESTPIILAKSCHDLDIMRWLVGKPSVRVAAFGNLKWFNKQNAPAGSTARCHDGCAIESTCPYSAVKIYLRERSYTYVFDLPEQKELVPDAIMNYLKTTNYGRCVYRMDNDQCDHYVMSLLFEGGITASFNMEAFTGYHGRRTRVMGSMGDLTGDMEQFVHTDFRTGKTTNWDSKSFDEGAYKNHGHGGGDYRLMQDWVQAVAQKNPNLLTSTIDASIESHLMGFAAEKSRKNKKIVDIRL
ncbi:MAG: Gfo/Idh/MocA family oxidoreductase [Saprospiraceae bacterium]|nr:Gfo/Idh/MocA family oxidoreductase [Saprospiraceae bacterium]MBK7738203.1 Gfo/Idh/MocA family oxidoreductase [Saprospiraceae bacterium]MBK7913222.1 Gfo/Idh/MocA family oxidoreductase [Saprospiraceae bacterium]